MVTIVEVIKAYEIFRSHGLDVQTNGRNKSSVSIQNECLNELMVGNTSKQLEFLSPLANNRGDLSTGLDGGIVKRSEEAAHAHGPSKLLANNRGDLSAGLDDGKVKTSGEAMYTDDPLQAIDQNKVIDHNNRTKSHEDRVLKETKVRILNEREVRRFKEALTGCNKTKELENGSGIRTMRTPVAPRYEGGNLIIDLDIEDFMKGNEELKYSIMGRLFL